jgi:cell division protein YceG involved in septum cleavage
MNAQEAWMTYFREIKAMETNVMATHNYAKEILVHELRTQRVTLCNLKEKETSIKNELAGVEAVILNIQAVLVYNGWSNCI